MALTSSTIAVYTDPDCSIGERFTPKGTCTSMKIGSYSMERPCLSSASPQSYSSTAPSTSSLSPFRMSNFLSPTSRTAEPSSVTWSRPSVGAVMTSSTTIPSTEDISSNASMAPFAAPSLLIPTSRSYRHDPHRHLPRARAAAIAVVAIGSASRVR